MNFPKPFRIGTRLALLVAVLTVGAMAPAAPADEMAVKMRAVLAQHAEAIITVSLVLKSSYSAESSELETQGLVVNETGLVVVTNMAIDPSSSFSRSMDGSGSSTSVLSAKYILGDGTEIPARLVLRDKDLSLAFLRPTKPLNLKLPHLNFKGATATSQVGDPVVLVGRLGKAGSRNISASLERLTTVINRPRKTYGLSFFGIMSLGHAVFTEKGELLGVVSVRTSKSSSTARSMNPTDGMMGSVIPASDVWEVAAQAPLTAANAPSATPPARKPSTKPAPKTPPKTKTPTKP